MLLSVLNTVECAHRWTWCCQELYRWTRYRQYTLRVIILQVRGTVITCSMSSNQLERTRDHISAMHWQTCQKDSHGEQLTVPWDGCVDEGYVSLHSLGEYAPASSVPCTIGFAARTCDAVWRRSSLYHWHCHRVYAMTQLLSPPHWYVIGLS